MTLKRTVWLWCALLLVVFLAGSAWIVSRSQGGPHRILVSAYDFSATLDGHATTAQEDPDLKGVTITPEHARALQNDNRAAWVVSVEGSADPGINLDYVMFFDPFYTGTILASADITVTPVASPEECTTGRDAASDDANMFYLHETLGSTDPEQPTRHHYCVNAQAPSDPEKLAAFRAADPEQERGVTLNIRHTAN